MKTVAAVIGWSCLAGMLAAQPNRLPADEAKAFARACLDQAATLGELPLKAEVDGDKPCAERGEGGGAMIIPAKSLSAAALAKLDKDILPLGQLWFRKWTPVVAGKPVPAEQLRIVTVNIDDKGRPMPLFLIGARKKGEKDLELVVFARDSEPLLVLPLPAAEMGQELPLELEWKRGEKADTLAVNVLGKYRAVIPIGRLDK